MPSLRRGTRGKADHWKTGFYYIALGANVPIALGFVDYKERTVGIGPSLYPSGDIHADFEQIRSFYASKTGRHPHTAGRNQNPSRIIGYTSWKPIFEESYAH